MMRLFIIAVIILYFNNSYSQQVFEIYREEFDKFFYRKELDSKFDILSLVDSLPENCDNGLYHFYDIAIKDSANKKYAPHLYGRFIDLKKNGEFIYEKFQYNKKIKSYEILWQQVITYQNGRKNGCHKEYYMSYQYNKQKKIINELSTITIYIEYTDNEYDGFYMVLTDYNFDDIQHRARLTVKYYEKGELIKSMKCDGLGVKTVYHNIGFD